MLGDGRKENLAVGDMLASKGITILDRPLPDGKDETVEWIRALSSALGRDFQDEISGIESEYAKGIARYSEALGGKRACIATWSPAEDQWIADALSDCGCDVTFAVIGPYKETGYKTICAPGPERLRDVAAGGYDAAVDTTGLLEGCVKVESTKTHLASLELMRRASGTASSTHEERWRTWGE